jgi:predicted  nucleic acid-binding Zn-ribbon protein
MDKSNAEGLMQKIASKFTLLESRISSQSQLNDRVVHLESKLPNAADLHSRLLHLESKIPNHSERMTRLESQMQPDPEHDRLITRINAKLDVIEKSQRTKPTRLAAAAPDDEILFLQDRVEKLTALRARYAREEKELMG